MKKLFTYIIGFVYILFGLYIFFNPLETLLTYAIVYGILHLASSISTLIYFYYYGIRPIPYGNIIVSILLSITIISAPFISTIFIVSMFTFLFLVVSIYYLYIVLNTNSKNHTIQLIFSIIAVIYGIVMFFNPVLAGSTIARVLAVFIIINGLSYVFPQKIEK